MEDKELAKELGDRMLDTIQDWAWQHGLKVEKIREISRIVLVGMIVTQPKSFSPVAS